MNLNLLSDRTRTRAQIRRSCAELASRWHKMPPISNENTAPKPLFRPRAVNWDRWADRFAEALLMDRHCAKKLLPRIRHGDTTERTQSLLARCVGFYRDANEKFSALQKLIWTGHRVSRTGLTEWLGLQAEWLADSEPRTKEVETEEPGLLGLPKTVKRTVSCGRDVSSTGSWDRWCRRVMRRAATILAGWDTHPSYMALQDVVSTTRRDDRLRSRQTRPHRAAVRVAAATLVMRFGWPADLGESEAPWSPVEEAGSSLRRAREVLVACRIHRRRGEQPSVPLPATRPTVAYRQNVVPALLTEYFGEQGDDDRVSPWNPVVVAWSPAGAIIADRTDDGQAPAIRRAPAATRLVQVVVRDPQNGKRHHLTVPPQFGLPLRHWESSAWRVRAAVAWTFGLTPELYSPACET